MERRRHKRWSKGYQVLLLLDNRVLEGTTLDLSQYGMRLTLTNTPDIKNEFPLSISLPIGRQELSAEIMWKESKSSITDQVGVQLVSVPAEYLNYTATLKYEGS